MDTLTLARSFTSLLLDTAAKGTALLLLAALAAWLCRRSSAALRHSIWCMTMGGLLVLPIASWALPAWQIPILPPEPLPTPVAEVARLPTPVAEPVMQGATGEGLDSPVPRRSTTGPKVFGQDTFKDTGSPERPPVAPSAPPVVEPMPTSAPALVEPVAEPLTTIEWTSLLVSATWLLGVSLFGVLLLVGLWRTVKLRRASLAVSDGEWPGMLVELQQRLRLSRSVELREHAESVVPLTWGIWRPVVLLPKLARAWDEPMRRAVLLHELAHVQRGDVACQVLGRLTCVLYWFHPLAWFALRQLRQEREQACDDAVVGTGEKASDYAEQLLQVARLCCAPRGLSLGVAMAEGSSLERRVKSLFDSARSHGPLTRRVALALFAIGGAILAGLAPIEPTASQAEPPVVEAVEKENVVANPPIETQERILEGDAARRQMELLKPVFGEAKRGIQLGLAVGSLERTFPQGGRIPLWLFYRNVGDKKLTFNLSHDFMNNPVTVADKNGKRVHVNFVMHWMFVAPLTITLKPGEVWCIATPGLYLGDRMPSIKPVAGKYKLTYPQGIWDVNTTKMLGNGNEGNGLVGEALVPNWSENLTTGTIEFEIAPGKNGQLEARVLAMADPPEQIETAENDTVQEEKIYKALESPTTLEFNNAPLLEVFETIADQHGVAIVLDAEGLKEVGLDSNSPISISVKGIQLASALKLILEPLKLSCVVENGVLNITSQERLTETGPLILRGRVLDAKQQPVEEALLVFPCFMKESAGTVLRIFRTHSGRDGAFMIKVPRETVDQASFSNHSLIWCQKDGHGLGAAQVFTALSSEPLTLKLPALERVEFIVQSDQGAPLPGVRVEVEMTRVPAWDGEMDNQQGSIGRVPEELKPFVTKVSDAEGKVILDTIPRDRHYDLKMTSEQYGVQHFQDPRKYLKLLPVAPVSGKLSNDQAGVKLNFSIPHRHFGSYIEAHAEVVTDAAGRFSIPKFPVGPVKITSPDLQGPMFLEATDREVVAGANNAFDLKVIPGIQVRGRVMLEKPRRGIRKASVGFAGEGGGNPIETDEDGNYTAFARPQPTISTYFVGSSGEPFQLIGSGLGLSGASVQVPEGATEVTLPDIVLAEGLLLTGQLLDENKQPVAGVYVAPFPASSPFQLQTGPSGNFGALIRADKRPSGWVVGWNSPPALSFGESDTTTWAKVISQEPLILQVSRKSQPERIIPYSEVDMDASVPMDQVVWGEIVDGWQPGFWLKSTGEPTNQQVPLNALVTYRLLLRNTSDEGRDVVFRKGPDVPYVIPSSQLAQALSAGELPQEFQSEVSKFVYKGIEDYVIFVAAGESLLLYGSDTSTQAGLFVGAGDSQRYSRLATVAKPGKNWIVQPLMVQTLTPEERTQLEESLKSDRSRSHWDMTMLDRNGQPRKETAKTATPQAKGIVGIPLTRLQTLYAKIEREVGTLVAAVPEIPAAPKKAPEEIQASLDSFPWSEAIGGLQTCILSGDSPDAPGIVEMNEMLAYGVTVRNPTDKRLDFLTRIELPYLVPEEQMQGELSPQFRAEPLTSAPRQHESIYRFSLESGECLLLPGLNAARSPDTAVSVGDAMGTMPDQEGDFPRIAAVHVGTNWIVQPLTIQMLTAAEAEAIKSLSGEFEIMKVDAKGKPSEAKVSLVDATLTGKAVVAKQRIEVATRSFLTEQHADDVTWGRIDKGLQCGIRLLNPKPSYKIGDTLEAETLWRNSSEEVISTTRPRQLDLYPIIQDAQGNAKLIDFGARFDLPPFNYDYQPSEVVSLGISKITLVTKGTPGPKDNKEPGHVTLEPGKYQLIGNGGVGNINPRSGKVEFVVEPADQKAAPAPEAPRAPRQIRGQIIDEEKLGVPNAEVLIVGGTDWNRPLEGQLIAQGVANEKGEFAIQIPESELAKKPWGQVWRRAPGYAAARGNSVQSLESLMEEPLTYGPLVRTEGLYLVVQDPSGKPRPGVRAEALSVRVNRGIGYPLPAPWRDDNSGVSDAEGRVHLPYIDPESLERLELTPEGATASTQFGPTYFLNYRPQEMTPHFIFPTYETGAIEGQLVAGPGMALPKGLTIPLKSLTGKIDVSGVREVAVDDKGNFRVPDMPAGEISILKFLDDAQPLRPWISERAYVKAGETTKLEIPIVTGTRVTGRVQKSDTKAGVADYEFEVYYGPAIKFRNSDLWLMTQPVKADAEGQFELFLPPGPINLRLTRYVDGYRDATWWRPREKQGSWGPLHEIPSKAQFELPVIDLVKMLPVQGTLVDQNDKPLSDGFSWDVHGYPEIPGEEERFVMNSMAGVHTDKEGRFDGTYPEPYPPVRWKVSHRVWKTKYEFDDIKYRAEVVQKEPLILRVDTTKPLED